MNLPAFARKHQLLSFFALTYLIMYAVLFGYVYLAPGQPLRPWSLVWFLSIFSPSTSALIVAALVGGLPEVKRLLSGLARWKVGASWYLAAGFLFLGPLAISLIYLALGNPYPGIREGETLGSMAGILLFTVFSGPAAEELGWRGFALPRLQAKYNALVSSLILGVIWCCWHIPLFFVTGSSQMSIPFPIYLALVVTQTFYMTWLYNNTGGSLPIAILTHFSYNATGFLTGVLRLMPPMVFYMTAGPLLALLVIAIVIFYGPKTLTRRPAAKGTARPALT